MHRIFSSALRYSSRLTVRAVGSNRIAIPVERTLRCPLLGCAVDVHQAEPLVVALGRLEVVEQAPGVGADRMLSHCAE